MMPSVLWHWWLGVRKRTWPVKIEQWCAGVVICLQQDADCLHMVQLMPLHSKTSSSLASFQYKLVLPFSYRLTQVVLENRPLNGPMIHDNGRHRHRHYILKTDMPNVYSSSNSLLVRIYHTIYVISWLLGYNLLYKFILQWSYNILQIKYLKSTQC